MILFSFALTLTHLTIRIREQIEDTELREGQSLLKIVLNKQEQQNNHY